MLSSAHECKRKLQVFKEHVCLTSYAWSMVWNAMQLFAQETSCLIQIYILLFPPPQKIIPTQVYIGVPYAVNENRESAYSYTSLGHINPSCKDPTGIFQETKSYDKSKFCPCQSQRARNEGGQTDFFLCEIG